MTMKKLLLFFFFSLLPFSTFADDSANETMHMITDRGISIDMAEVDYLLGTDSILTFTVVCKNGTLVENVRELTFAMMVPSTISKPTVEQPLLLTAVVNGSLTITGCVRGTTVSIYSTNGRLQCQAVATDGTATLDISSLPPAHYLIKTDNTTLKFTKK